MIEIKFQVTAGQLADPNIIYYIGRLEKAIGESSGVSTTTPMGPTPIPTDRREVPTKPQTQTPGPVGDLPVAGYVPVLRQHLDHIEVEVPKLPLGGAVGTRPESSRPESSGRNQGQRAHATKISSGPRNVGRSSTSTPSTTTPSSDTSTTDSTTAARDVIVSILYGITESNGDTLGRDGTTIAKWMIDGIKKWRPETATTQTTPQTRHDGEKVVSPPPGEPQPGKVEDSDNLKFLELLRMLKLHYGTGVDRGESGTSEGTQDHQVVGPVGVSRG